MSALPGRDYKSSITFGCQPRIASVLRTQYWQRQCENNECVFGNYNNLLEITANEKLLRRYFGINMNDISGVFVDNYSRQFNVIRSRNPIFFSDQWPTSKKNLEDAGNEKFLTYEDAGMLMAKFTADTVSKYVKKYQNTQSVTFYNFSTLLKCVERPKHGWKTHVVLEQWCVPVSAKVKEKIEKKMLVWDDFEDIVEYRRVDPNGDTTEEAVHRYWVNLKLKCRRKNMDLLSIGHFNKLCGSEKNEGTKIAACILVAMVTHDLYEGGTTWDSLIDRLAIRLMSSCVHCS